MPDPPIIQIEKATGPFFAGIDVGGTSIKIGVVDDLGGCVASCKIPTQQERGPEDAMRRVADTAQEMCQQLGLRYDRVVAVGLATPGTMDLPEGRLIRPHNLPDWWEFPIRDCLKAACGRPVAFANDANAAAFGEFWVGRGSDSDSIALFTLGTGVGGGVIVGDLSIDGEHSTGSEVGHMIIDHSDTARMCGCGQRGHLEAYASGIAVVQRAMEQLEVHRDSSLQSRLKQENRLTPLVVAEEAEAGDSLALQLVMDTARYLGVGAVNVMHIIDPGAVIFGGAMDFGGHASSLGRRFLQTIRDEVTAKAFPVLAQRTHIDFATLGSNAGFIGAAGIARAASRK